MLLARVSSGARAFLQQTLVALAGASVLAAAVALRAGGALAWASWGLLFVPMVVSALLVGAGRSVGLVPEVSAARAWLQREGSARRLSLGAVWLSSAWLLGSSVALALLERNAGEPRRVGTLLALSVLAVVLVLSIVTDLALRWLLAAAFVRSWRSALGGLRFAVPALLLLVGIGLPIALGETAGRGHALALMGVFRRQELDLRPVLELCALGFAAALAGAVPVRGRSALAWVGLGLALAGAVASVSVRQIDARSATVLVRGGGLSSVCLSMLTRLSDSDRDGAAAQYGGGDCNDRDAAIYPGAIDTPGNGRDEDCDGQDAAPRDAASSGPAAPAAPSPKSPAGTSGASALSSRFWPKDTNVLLLTVDTLRFDLGFMRPGGGGRLSPRLDELAQKCTVYERAYSLASYTSKSLGPMLIGKYSSEVARSFEHFDRFGKTELFLQERIQRAGHLTASVQAYWYFFLKGYGFERGFDRLDHDAAPKLIAVDGDASVTGEKLADAAIEQLKSLDAHPGRFFAWAHWVDPHSEYVPHAEFDLGESSRQRYDGEVAYVDHQLGRVLDALAQRPFAERTAILVTSDHGEAFGEHRMIRHGFELWEELVRVPLLLCVPGSPPRRIDVPRSQIDLVPTVLELLDVEAPPGDLRGTSWLRDVAASEPARRPVLVDMPRGPNNQERRAFISGKHKLITSAGRVIGLYDLSTDPAETNDLSSSESLAREVQAEFKAFVATLQVRAPG